MDSAFSLSACKTRSLGMSASPSFEKATLTAGYVIFGVIHRAPDRLGWTVQDGW